MIDGRLLEAEDNEWRRKGDSPVSMLTLHERLLDWYARRLPSRLVALLSLPIGRQLKTKWHFWYERARMLELAFAYTSYNEVKGDYFEFGVYEGRTFIEAWDAARRYDNKAVRFYAFDSFEGLPELSSVDAGGPFCKGQFKCDRHQFEKNLKSHGVDPRRVKVIEGRFETTLNEADGEADGLESVAIAWIDCDLYKSTVPVLRYLSDRLVDGSIVIFDDWYCYKGRADQGEQRACLEWLEANPQIGLSEYQKFHWAGISFIVTRLQSSELQVKNPQFPAL